jgi:hypothetical protein
MTADTTGPVQPPATIFDRMVAHERGADADAPGSLRPRLPYPFESLPLPEEIVEFQTPPRMRAAGEATVVPRPAVAPSTAPQPANEPPHELHDASRSDAGPAPLKVGTQQVAADRPSTPPSRRLASEVVPIKREGRDVMPIDQTRDAPTVRTELRTRTLTAPVTEARRQDETLPNPMQRATRQFTPPQNPAQLRTVPHVALPEPAAEPTIEIRIGRIEVRAAVQSPAIAPASRTAEPAPDRLGPYLGRRSRGARS